MKRFTKILILAAAIVAPTLAHAQLLESFSSFPDSSNTFFFGTWELNGDTNGTNFARSTFSSHGGVFDIIGGTNADTSKIESYFGSIQSLGTNRTLSVTAEVLAGNVASSFQVSLFDTSGKVAFATYTMSSFSSSAYTTQNAVLTADVGFNWNSVEFFRLSGNEIGGSSTFNVSFDNFAVIPETSTYAAIFGALTLGVVAVRRYRKSAA